MAYQDPPLVRILYPAVDPDKTLKGQVVARSPFFAAHGDATHGLGWLAGVLIDEKDPGSVIVGRTLVLPPRWIVYFYGIPNTRDAGADGREAEEITYTLQMRSANNYPHCCLEGIHIYNPSKGIGVDYPIEGGTISATNPVCYGQTDSATPITGEIMLTQQANSAVQGTTVQGPPTYTVQFPAPLVANSVYDILVYNEAGDTFWVRGVTAVSGTPPPPPPVPKHGPIHGPAALALQARERVQPDSMVLKPPSASPSPAAPGPAPP
jgi:hypothetical protein